jgi:hypothetical protein
MGKEQLAGVRYRIPCRVGQLYRRRVTLFDGHRGGARAVAAPCVAGFIAFVQVDEMRCGGAEKLRRRHLRSAIVMGIRFAVKGAVRLSVVSSTIHTACRPRSAHI